MVATLGLEQGIRRHGSEPRGLEAVKKQQKPGYLPDAGSPFGSRFGRLFPASETTEKIPESAIEKLAGAMVAPFDAPKDGMDAEESGIPALFTYLGQFIDHDLTFDPEPNFKKIKDARAVVDFRTAAFDLDNVYGRGRDDQPFMYDKDRFLLGAPLTGEATKKGQTSNAHDLPRNSMGRALIGDPRNDENSIVSQLQGLFYRAHNRAIGESNETDETKRFNETQRTVRDHYQYMVMNDFLPKIVSDSVLSTLKTSGRWDPAKLTLFTSKRLGQDFNLHYPFMPVEFSVAAYRLGHSMVRPGYRLNDGTIEAIFPVDRKTGRRFPEGLTGFRTLITDWAIDWARFIDTEERDYGPDPDKAKNPGPHLIREMFRRLQFAYRIDTSLVDPLGSLPPSVAAHPASLALRNLRRGVQFRLPTGQEVAHAMGLTPLPDGKILIGKATDGHPKDEKPTPIGEIANGAFKGKCPLWTYILAEAAHHKTPMKVPAKGAPHGGLVSTPQLGPVGGRIVAETFWVLLAADRRSFLHGPDWKPNGGVFGLREMVLYALGDPGVKMTPRP